MIQLDFFEKKITKLGALNAVALQELLLGSLGVASKCAPVGPGINVPQYLKMFSMWNYILFFENEKCIKLQEKTTFSCSNMFFSLNCAKLFGWVQNSMFFHIIVWILLFFLLFHWKTMFSQVQEMKSALNCKRKLHSLVPTCFFLKLCEIVWMSSEFNVF